MSGGYLIHKWARLAIAACPAFVALSGCLPPASYRPALAPACEYPAAFVHGDGCLDPVSVRVFGFAAFRICPEAVAAYHLADPTRACRVLGGAAMCTTTTQPDFVPERYFFSRLPDAQRTVSELTIKMWVAQHPEDRALLELLPEETRPEHVASQRYAALEAVLKRWKDAGVFPEVASSYYIDAADLMASSRSSSMLTTVTEIEVPLQQLEAGEADPGFFCQYPKGADRLEHLRLALVVNDLGTFAVVDGLTGSEACRRHPGHELANTLQTVCRTGTGHYRDQANAAVSVMWRAFWDSLAAGTPYAVKRKCLPDPEEQ